MILNYVIHNPNNPSEGMGIQGRTRSEQANIEAILDMLGACYTVEIDDRWQAKYVARYGRRQVRHDQT